VPSSAQIIVQPPAIFKSLRLSPALAGEVPRLRCDAALGTQGGWKVLANEMIGQLLHFGRIGAARVQHGAAAPVDGARVFSIQRDE
jgi:hypothetical protein